uniref:Ovule protein n=1 Tax=Caenorhabditis tropicalis TaxID=1561998 RepID=A0A1I7TPD6_9PELO
MFYDHFLQDVKYVEGISSSESEGEETAVEVIQKILSSMISKKMVQRNEFRSNDTSVNPLAGNVLFFYALRYVDVLD